MSSNTCNTTNDSISLSNADMDGIAVAIASGSRSHRKYLLILNPKLIHLFKASSLIFVYVGLSILVDFITDDIHVLALLQEY